MTDRNSRRQASLEEVKPEAVESRQLGGAWAMKRNSVRYLYDEDSRVEWIFSENASVSYPLHNHVSVLTVGLVLDGAVSLFDGCDFHRIETGGIFVVLPYTPHSIQAENPYALLSLCVGKNILGACEEEKREIKGAAAGLFNKALDLCTACQSHMERLIGCLDSLPVCDLDSAQLSAGALIGGLRQRLEESPEKSFSVEEMARNVFFSKYHFIRRFKQEVGLTPHQFQIQNRVRLAQRLLRQGETAAETALSAGFCDQSHFIKQFEKYVGMTPTDYRTTCHVARANSGR